MDLLLFVINVSILLCGQMNNTANPCCGRGYKQLAHASWTSRRLSSVLPEF